MSYDFDTVVDFNKQGTVFFENGLYTHAFDMFMGALQAIYMHAESSTSTSAHFNSSKYTDENSRIAVAKQKQHLQPDIKPPHNELALMHQTVSSFIYKKPILIPLLEKDRIIDTETRNTISSAAILYNVALTYHIQSYLTTKLRDPSLQRARAFYEKSISLLTTIEEENTVRQYSVTHLIMALLNNLGHVNFELYDFKMSKRYMEKLCKIVLDQEATTYTHVHEEREQFLLNGTLLKEPQYAAAA